MQAPPVILIVDDDHGLRDLLALCLEDEVAEVATAADGLSALLAIEQQPPQVIILDVNMPGMDGWTFLREIERRDLADIPVILASGDPDVEEKTAGLNIVGFLPKPFDLQELDILIHRALSISK